MKTARLVATFLALSLSTLSAHGQSPQGAGITAVDESLTVAVRRLTESEYRHTIADVFGPDIEINARFETEQREAGLMAIGNARLSLTSSGFEQYFVLASAIAEQVLNAERRESTVTCQPRDANAADAQCARQFISHYGEYLFRRPLAESEIGSRLESAEIGASQAEDFYAGLRLALTSLLVAPDFLFRVEIAEPDPDNPEQFRLDSYTKASRLSFMFWNTSPDRELLDTAASGAIHTEAGLNAQISRLSESPRLETGARAFFEDMFQLDGFENLVKDPAIYPKFNQTITDSAREQMLKTAVELLVKQGRDYRDLFVSNDTFINRALAAVYQVPYVSAQDWAPYTFSDASGRSGIITQVGFLSLFAHPGTSSPTRRGIKIHEIFMCEPTPDPPADVDFSQVQDSAAGTVRGRLLDHMENTGCTVCHRRSDPPGLALEHFDGLGQLRTLENGVPIDVSAELNGETFVGATGLGEFLYKDQRVPACLVRNVFSYGVARTPEYSEQQFLRQQIEEFASNGYRFPELLVQIASTPEFFAVVLPEGLEEANLTVSADAAQSQ